MPGAHADDGRHIKVELFRLSVQQDRIVDERDGDQYIGIGVFELLHEWRHIRHELIIPIIKDEFDPEILGASASARGNGREERHSHASVARSAKPDRRS